MDRDFFCFLPTEKVPLPRFFAFLTTEARLPFFVVFRGQKKPSFHSFFEWAESQSHSRFEQQQAHLSSSR